MSVVAVKKYKDKILISADSIMLCGDKKWKTTKLFYIPKHEFIIGSVGPLVSIEYIVDYIKRTLDSYKIEPSIKKVRDLVNGLYHTYMNEIALNNKDKETTIGNDYLIVWEDIVYKVKFIADGGFYDVVEVEEMDAIGYGDYAFGAMKFGATPEEAINLTTEFCIYTDKPVITYEVKLEENNEIEEFDDFSES